MKSLQTLTKLAKQPFLWRGLIAFILLWWAIKPAPILVTLGPPQKVVTINPKMGVHTRLTDEVEEWKIKRTLQMVREMGAPWIVEYFPWAYHEPRKGFFNWDHADMVVEHALNQGLTVIARLGFVPQWARPKESAFSYLDEKNFEDFGDFVYAFVDHFRGKINYIIIWNEPNISLEWGYRPVDPEAYTRLLKIAYRRAREADPEIKVLAGALAPTLAPPGDPWGMNDLEYLRRMYQAGAKDHFDILAVHSYGWTFPPDDPPAPDKINFRRVELLRQIMVENGDAHKPIIITEGGWNDHPRWSKAVRPAQRIHYTIRAYEIALKEWEWCLALCIWAFRYPWATHTYQDYFTFVAVDFTPKPIYFEVQRYARGELAEEKSP
ncbi:MAG: beta-galactosidase [Anaerolineae bacterium]|nr:beta-galactosidase [Anaerolineae bacterium]MDW8102634.1 beta-galactosidase [Anaerolineae bacterium]